MHLSTQATAPSVLPYQPDPAPLTFRSPIALSSYHPNPIHTTAVRRGAAWPARRPSGCLVVRGHNTGARLSVRSLGMAAKEVRMPAVVSSPCPRSCPASGVQCLVRASGVRRGPVQVTGVRCGRLSVQVSSVRRPVSVRRGVRRGVRLRGVAGAGSRTAWDGRGRRGRPPCS
jgi:hypothetical protein